MKEKGLCLKWQAASFPWWWFSFPIYFLYNELSPWLLTILVDTAFNFCIFDLTWYFTLNNAVGRRLGLLCDTWITKEARFVIPLGSKKWVSY